MVLWMHIHNYWRTTGKSYQSVTFSLGSVRLIGISLCLSHCMLKRPWNGSQITTMRRTNLRTKPAVIKERESEAPWWHHWAADRHQHLDSKVCDRTNFPITRRFWLLIIFESWLFLGPFWIRSVAFSCLKLKASQLIYHGII